MPVAPTSPQHNKRTRIRKGLVRIASAKVKVGVSLQRSELAWKKDHFGQSEYCGIHILASSWRVGVRVESLDSDEYVRVATIA